MCVCTVGFSAYGASLMNLFAQVSFSIQTTEGGANLPDGSLVYIIGSGDTTIDPMVSQGTNFVSYSTTGDDDIVGVVRIGDNAPSGSGQFTWNATIQRYTNMYIRYFTWTNDSIHVVGYTNWGESQMQQVNFGPFGLATIDFAPTTNLYTTNADNFIIIPEPGTAGLMLFSTVFLRLFTRRKK